MRWIANGARERLSRSSVDDGDELARGAAGDAGPFFRALAGSDAFARARVTQSLKRLSLGGVSRERGRGGAASAAVARARAETNA